MSETNNPASSNDKKPVVFAVPSSSTRRGINAVHVNSAREMVSRVVGSSHAPTTKATDSMSSKFPNIQIPLHHDETECKNPQCQHCGQIIIPSPQSSYPIQDKPSISVNGWSVFTTKKPILNSLELDHLAETKFDFPLPEMIFGNNNVRIRNDVTGGTIEFNAIDALSSLDPNCPLKVSCHEEWLKSRRSKHAKNLDGLKPYDWTYSTNYKGTLQNLDLKSSTLHEIPIDKLTKPDPILFFDEAILFEDELADNGISILSYKIRVMPTCLLLLCRFFLRIDDVIFRVRDTRCYIDFETNTLIREYKVQEQEYDKVMSLVKVKNNKDPKKLFRDSNWVSQNIPVLNKEIETIVVNTEN
ncbi:TIP41-like family protein [Candida albicans]|uniref:TIP41-like family protein n=1 Tax=Candida albicans TaxID=5476 RepID=A0A8H6BR71_CANAX|nr:TIP41-like family protein [Candida albicans]